MTIGMDNTRNMPFPVSVAQHDWLLNEPSFVDSFLGESLRQQPLGFIDIGARGGVSELVRPIASKTAVLGFEPDRAEAARLKSSHEANPHWHAFEIETTAVAGNKGEREFFETARGLNSSLLRPSADFAQRYQVPGFAVDRVRPCEVDTLDSLLFTKRDDVLPYGELLKIDAQGAELEILQGSSRLLSERTVAIICEVSFCELYEQQPLFGDVAKYLGERGFDFYGFQALSHRASHLRHLNLQSSNSWIQRLIHGDAVFFRKDVFDQSDDARMHRLRAMVCCCAILLGRYDTAAELIEKIKSSKTNQLLGMLERLATHTVVDDGE